MERKPYSDTPSRKPANRRAESVYASGRSQSRTQSERYNSTGAPRSGAGYSGSSAARSAYDGSRSSSSRRPTSQSAHGSRSSYGSQPPRGPVRRKPRSRFEFNRNSIILLICLAVVLVLLGIVGSAWITATVNRSIFCPGIYINDINMRGMSYEEGCAAVRNTLNERLNTPYTFSGGGFSYTFTPSDFMTAADTDSVLSRAWNLGHVGSIFDRSKTVRQLQEQPLHFDVKMNVNEAALNAFVDRICSDIYIAPVDATVVVDLSGPVLTGESSVGREVDRDTLRAQFDALLSGDKVSLELPIFELQPSISSDRATSTLDMIVEFSTDVSFRGYNSRYNVRKALSYFNGFCVHPGETVDFNEIVGERNEVNGWMEATEYAANNTTKGYGGGVCQASSTLYNAVIRALGYESIIRRDAHSMTVTYLEPSLDAAVTNTNRNFIFKNVTENPIYIFTEVDKKNATVRIFGTRPEYRYDLVSVIVQKDASAVRKGFIEDTEGTFVYYTTDPPVLYKEGIPACSSQSWIVAFDWGTGEEVWRKQLENDRYESGTDIYWIGVHSPEEAFETPQP